MTGLTKTTISSIINEFIALGIVEESSTISTGNVGKSPTPLHIRTDAVYTVGAHLGREKVKTVLMDARMNIISRKKGLSYERLGPKGVCERLFLSIDDSIRDAEKHNIEVRAIGIGVPGPLDAQTGVVRRPPKFKGWKDVPLGKIVNERYKLPVWIENDANVGVLAEKWHGGGKDLRNFVYILINEGIGAGVVIDDELYQGAYDYVGEIGHTLFYDRGKFRYLEYISGVDILIKKVRSQGDVLVQLIKEIVSKYLFGDQVVDVRLSEVSENAVAIGAAIYATTKWLGKKSTERVPAKRG